MKNIDENTKFFYKMVGFGTTSYEEGSDFLEIRNGVLYTETSSQGMKWDDVTQTWVGGNHSVIISIVPIDDEAALKYMRSDRT